MIRALKGSIRQEIKNQWRILVPMGIILTHLPVSRANCRPYMDMPVMGLCHGVNVLSSYVNSTQSC